MEHPELTPGEKYEVIFQMESSDSNTAPTGPNDRTLMPNRCIFVGNVGDWWGFIGADGITRVVVNPASVAYVTMQIPLGATASDFGYFK